METRTKSYYPEIASFEVERVGVSFVKSMEVWPREYVDGEADHHFTAFFAARTRDSRTAVATASATSVAKTKVPLTWWDHFKEECFCELFKVWWPVQWREVREEVTEVDESTVTLRAREYVRDVQLDQGVPRLEIFIESSGTNRWRCEDRT